MAPYRRVPFHQLPMSRRQSYRDGWWLPLPTVPFSEHQGLEVTLSEPRSLHATFSPPKGVSNCNEDAAGGVEPAEPWLPTKARVERCRRMWNAFCEKQDPSAFAMNDEVAEMAASLAEATLPPVARAALEEQLGLAPGSLTNGSVQVVRMRAHRMEAEVVVLDPAQRRMRSAYVRLIGPEDLGELARVMDLLQNWSPESG